MVVNLKGFIVALLVSILLASAAAAQSFTPNLITGYRPAPIGSDNSQYGLSDKIEGGDTDSSGKLIWGEHTFEDYHNGQGGSDAYVAVAMDKNSAMQGKYLTSDQYPGTVFKVVDNGGFGNGKTGNNWMDIAWTDPNMSNGKNSNAYNKNGSNGWSTFNVVSKDEAQAVAAQRDPDKKYSGDSGDYIVGGKKGIKPADAGDDAVPGSSGENGDEKWANGSKLGRPFNNIISNKPNRIYEKGVSQSSLNQMLKNITQANEMNMQFMSCNKPLETSRHSKGDLEKDWEIKIKRCGIHYKYKGSGQVIGRLWSIVGYCYPSDVYIVSADEIEYRFPVETRESSAQIGDSPLRMKPGQFGDAGSGGGHLVTAQVPQGPGQVGNGTTDTNCEGVVSFNSNADIDTDGRGNNVGDEREGTSFEFSDHSPVPADKYSFIVMPQVRDQNGNWSCPDAGKCAKVVYNGKPVYGFVGDCGPSTKTGEVSMLMAQQFDHYSTDSAFGGKEGPTGSVKYTVYSSTIGRNPQSNESIQAFCKQAADLADEKCKNGGTSGPSIGTTSGPYINGGTPGPSNPPINGKPILGTFLPAFQKCAPGCSYGNGGITGDTAHKYKMSCHNSDSAIDILSITCNGATSGPGSSRFNEFVSCMVNSPGLYVIHGIKPPKTPDGEPDFSHEKHAHIGLYDCEHNDNGKIQLLFNKAT